MIKKDNILRFENLSQFDSLIHGFSTSFFGSLRPSHSSYDESLQKFSQALGITKENLIRMHQVHSNVVYFASEKDRGQTVDQTDGLITDKKNIFLGVVTGDCIPLLFYDPTNKLVASVHAGWRGLFSEIIKVTVSEMVEKGSDVSNIFVGIGPCIRVCCYDIPKERADMYLAKFPDWDQFIVERNDKFFFDIPAVAKSQLQNLGIPVANIEDADYCTFDHTDVYSYRREGKEFGEMMGVIGLGKK